MAFYVKKDELRSVRNTIADQVENWTGDLEDIKGTMDQIIAMESFQGQAAEAVKAYLSEIHGLLIAGMASALQNMAMVNLLYVGGYDDIDIDAHAKICENTLNKADKAYDASKGAVEDIQSGLKAALESVSDLFSSGLPGTGTLYDRYEEIDTRIATLKSDVIAHEDRMITTDLAQLRVTIEGVRSYLTEILGKTGDYIVNYQSGDFQYDTNIYSLAVSIQKTEEYSITNADALEKAIEDEAKVQEQLEKEAAEARKDAGLLKIVVGTGLVITNVVVIVGTFGAGAPASLAVTASVCGGMGALYGVSEIAEGGQDVYYGSKGDLTSVAFNPIRDTIFQGNQEAYDAWGQINTFVASLCLPAATGLQTAKITGGKAVVEAGKAIAKEQIIDGVSDGVAEFAVEQIDKEGNLKEYQREILKGGISAVTSAGIEKGVNKIEGESFRDKMSKSEQKQYDDYWLEKARQRDSGEPFHPNDLTMDEVNRMNLGEYRLQEITFKEELAASRAAAANKTDTPSISSPKEIIRERTADLDLEPHPSKYKQLSPSKMEEIETKIENRTCTKEEYKTYEWNKDIKRRRDAGVREFWSQEADRIENGEPLTRNWTPEQIEAIRNGERPKFDGKTLEGHHAYSVSEYPHLADRGEVIYPATRNEHLRGWHGGNYHDSIPGEPIVDIRDF